MNTLLRKKTFGGQTVTLEEMESGIYRLKSFGNLPGSYQTIKDPREAFGRFGVKVHNLTKYILGNEHYL